MVQNINIGMARDSQLVKPKLQKLRVALCDRRIAKILELRKGHFDVIHVITAPDLNIDGLDNKGVGRGAGFKAGHHAYSPSMQQSRQEEMALARNVSEWLEREYNEDKFKFLMLVAAPRMLGAIRANLGKQLSSSILAQSNKQLTTNNNKDLTDELLRLIPGPSYDD